MIDLPNINLAVRRSQVVLAVFGFLGGVINGGRFNRAAGQPERATKMVMTPDSVRIDNSKRCDCRQCSLATHR